ncbi:meiosis 1 arrest protein isoform X4 [Falco naumanni]|uniref:meiosis 1 arrest protein isoform X4 n=1 Tax=Falco naumanni TaxID=148594 RepID=UPI001ADE62EA|nr:meiosis 1 arrest protein isoform X4 [Falco naumanni]
MNSRKLLSETRRTFPATKVHCQQPARILIVDVTSPSQTNTCSVLSEALENTLCLACALTGTCRVPLLSLYVVQNQQECLLPFTQVKENFARIQACISELRSLPREGSFPQRGHGVVQAVQDGLQQFKQYSRHTAAGSSTNSSVEPRTLRLDIKKKRLSAARTVWRTSGYVAILGMDIDVQTIEDNVISLEMLFKTWLHDYGTEREHLHLLLPSGGFSHATAPRTTLSISFSLPLCRELLHPTALKITQACPMGMFSHVPHPMCLKCDLQERLLDPALLSGTADGTMRAVDLNSPCQMAAWPATVLYKLRVIKALKSEGVCESVLYGLPFIIKPTTCWQLDWDELEINQHSFHALCHSLLKRKWMLLAKREPQNTSPNWNIMVHSYYIIIPSDSATLLVKAVAIRELLLPSTFPALLAEQPERVHGPIESALNSLEVEVAYNPLHLKSNLYKYLKSMLYKPLHRQQAQPRDQRPERHQPKQHQSRAKATVAPLLMAPSPAQVFRPPAVRRDSCERSLLPKEYDEFLQ